MSEPNELPNAVVTGYTVSTVRPTIDDAEHKLIVLSLQFHVGAGEYTARQNFIMHSLDAKELRAMLKNPQDIQPTTAEEAPQ